MRNRPTDSDAFSLVEMLFAVVILTICVMMGIYGWNYTYRGVVANTTQAELDMNVRTAIERIRAETRLSAIDKMVYYPVGPGPYEAISFPVAFSRDNEGLVQMLSETNILWDTTIIFHVDHGSPNRLLRTTFTPRDNAMGLEQRMEQLAGVVAEGHGEGLEGAGELTVTRVVFANFFSWSIIPVAGIFDAYSENLGKRRVNFGAFPLGPGVHRYTFSARGKNTASRGYKLGIDTLRVSAAGCNLEAEEQEQVDCQPAPVTQFGFAFSGRNYLVADPGSGQDVRLTLAIPHDRWTETSFRTYGIGSANVENALYGAAMDDVIRLYGTGVTWRAAHQTGSAAALLPAPVAQRAYRVLLQGSDLGWIRHNGRLMHHPAGAVRYSGVRLQAPATATLGEWGSIALAEPTATTALKGRAGTFRTLKLTREADGSVLAALADAPPLEITPTNNYVVSFWVGASDGVIAWTNTRDSVAGMAAVRTNCAAGEAAAVLNAADWTALPDVALLNAVPFVQELVTAFPAQGAFVSQAFNTTLPAPEYTATRWHAVIPSGTRLRLQYRAGSDERLTDATPWSAVAYQHDANGLSMDGFGRFVQFRALFEPDATGLATPILRSASVEWDGQLRMVDLGGEVVVGPDFGAFQLTVDDKPLIKGLRFELAIFKDLAGSSARRLTSSMIMEIEPRNSGK